MPTTTERGEYPATPDLKPGHLQPSPLLIRDARMRKGWTVPRLASESGISKVSIYAIENGREPRMTTVAKLAEALGVEVKDLLTRVGA